MPPSNSQPDEHAVRLAVAIGRLRIRLREEARTSLNGLSISHLAILKRLRNDGPATAASLAAAEYVSQQAIAQSLTALKAAGLVRAAPDPSDRRKSRISVTAAGRKRIEAVHASRDAWLVRAFDATVAPNERADLEKAISLLERLADAPLGADPR